MEDTTMKKTYINPELEVIKIATQQMLAASTLTLDDTVEITNESDLLSREAEIDFDNF